MRKGTSTALALVAIALVAAEAVASDGMLEINQACVATGCVPGDAGGFPVTLSQSGSYRLTSNLAPTTGQTAIDVTADDVAIDLGGFTIGSTNVCSGPPSADATCTVSNTAGADGIKSTAARTRVHSGTVVGMGGSGVDLGEQAEVEGVSVANDGDNGIQISSGRISGCSAYGNHNIGLIATNAVILHDESIENRGAGVVAQGLAGSLAEGDVVYGNVGYGVTAGTRDGYVHDVINANNGGNANPQLPGGNNLGGNVCGNDTTCP